MQAKRNTLFSISNATLKKERPYALLVLRIWFILECLSYLLVFIGLPYFIIFSFPELNWYYSSGTSSVNLLEVLWRGLFLIILFLPIFLSFSVAFYKWRMQLWIYDLFVIPLVMGCIEYFLARPYLETRFFFLSVFFLIIPIMAAWRVRSFLRSQPNKGEESAGINTRTLREFFVEDILKTKKNTLFSIKSQELRTKCRFSLLLMRLFFIVLCFMVIASLCMRFWSLAVHLEGAVSFEKFPSFLLQLELLLLWQLVTLGVWSYTFLGISFLSSFLIFLLNQYGIFSSFNLLAFLFLLIVIAAWRVHIVSRNLSDTQSSNNKDDAGTEPEYMI